ncbi:MAG: hypothetical protein NC094_02135 [Bacteroidales bacterium]|nr:hypothetical protein [Lachnoclostridium sp.]MCM1383521.1 hypothetical protein [Lachnoclostridium sp.]MCM1464196.1 hypothetical protein [Bacteroidales bacterium]
MEEGTNASLLYVWNQEKWHLDYAITEAESQLVSVNRRLHGLWQDLALYAGILVVPVIFWKLLQYVGMWLLRTRTYIVSNTFVYVLLQGAGTVLICVYILSFPVLAYSLLKTIALLWLNKENPQQTGGLLPPEKGKIHKELDKEPTYRIEQQKLVHVLSRYYLYRDNMEELRKKVDAGSISLDSLKKEMEGFIYYETIHPASEFGSSMTRKARQTVFIFLFGIMALLLLLWRLFG